MVALCVSMKLQTEYDVDDLTKKYMFGNYDISENSDTPILLGDFTMEDSKLPPQNVSL